MKGSKGEVEVVPMAVPLVTFPTLWLGMLLVLGPGPDMVKATGGEPGVGGEPEKSEEDSKCGLRGGRTR